MTGEKIALPTYETLLIEAIRSLAVDSGTVSVIPPAGAPVLQDSSKNWTANVHAGRLVKIIRGTGAGQLRVVQSNTATVLTVTQTWTIPLNTTSVYVILGESIISALLDMNLTQWGGVVLTGRDVSLDLANLDAALSTRAAEATLATRASEATLASILAALDVALSTRASEATVTSLLAQLDVALSTRASEATLATMATEATLAGILATLDVALSTRASEATLATRASETTLASILAALDVALSTRASETTVTSLLAQLDVALSTRAASAQLPAAPTVAGNLKVSLEEQSITPQVQEYRNLGYARATGNAAIALSLVLPGTCKLIQVRCHFSAAPVSAGSFTVTLNAGAGAAYDTLLYSRDPSVGSLTDLVIEFGDEHIYEANDEIDVVYANPDGRTYGVALVYELLRTT